MISHLYQQVLRQPNATALHINNTKLSYAEIWQLAHTNAIQMQNAGIKPGDIVALHLEKSNEFVIAQIACWLLGAVFLPLPPDWPLQRKKQTLAIANCKFIFTHQVIKEAEATQVPPITVFEEIHYFPYFNLCEANQTAYVIFTSGSSGSPKGVEITFSGLLHVITAQIHTVKLEPQAKSLWLHHISFDASIADVWVSLLAGAELYAKEPFQAENIFRIVNEQGINYIDLPSPLLPLLNPKDSPDCLNCILVGGEVSDLLALKSWAKFKRVIIAYGPTETTICSSMFHFNASDNTPGLIGKPLAHLHYALKKSDSKKIDNNIGELIIYGKGVAKGHINSSGNQQRFQYYESAPAYFTGDLVRKLEYGYQFIGRIDRQFKFRGKLVCPEEVEQVLSAHTGISECYVYQMNGSICAATCGSLTQEEMTTLLKGLFPHWMIPSIWLILDSLPRNTHNKPDTVAIKRLHHQQINTSKNGSENHEHTILASIRNILSWPEFTYSHCLHDKSPDSIQWLEIIVSLRSQGLYFTPETLQQEKPFEQLLTEIDSGSAVEELDAPTLKKILKQYPLHCNLEESATQDAIFITGANGKLGKELLKHITSTGRRTYCLVRGGSARLNEGLEFPLDTDNLTCLDGDIRQPKLGLTPIQWKELCSNVSDIYHCAADTSLIKKCHELEETNVCGTFHLLQLLEQGQKKRVHYASTLALVVDSDWRTKNVDESNQLKTGIYTGGYCQSKWLAEQLVQQVPYANIFRFGLLISQTENTRPSTSIDWIETQLKKLPDLSSVPDYFSLDFTPLKYAAEMMFGVSNHMESGIYHICHPTPVTAKKVKRACDLLWKTQKEQSRPIWNESPNSPFRIFKMTNTLIDTSEAQLWARKLAIGIPSVTTTNLVQYLETI